MELTELAAPFTTRQALGAGISRDVLRRAVRERIVRRVLRGVYVGAGVADTIETRVASMALVVGRHVIICDRTAAWIHGVDVFGYDDLEVLAEVETCSLRGRGRPSRSGVDGRSRDLKPRDIMDLGLIRVTTPLRTALDLGCCLGRHRALGAIDLLIGGHEITRGELARELPRFVGRRGVVQLRQLIPLADGRSESIRESWIRLDIIDAGLPMPELQYWVVIDGVPTYRLDLAYPHHRIAIEYDGEEFHRRTPAQREYDRMRRKWLREHGWTVIVVDKSRVNDPESWLPELVEALRPASRRLRWSKTR